MGYVSRRSQGYESALFLDAAKAQDFTCAICIGVARDAVKTRCKHVFCNSCMTFALRAKRECPLCRRAVPREGTGRTHFQLPPKAPAQACVCVCVCVCVWSHALTEEVSGWDVSVRSAIGALEVKCPNTDLGCEWKGKLSALSAHSSGQCAFVDCPLAKYGCTER